MRKARIVIVSCPIIELFCDESQNNDIISLIIGKVVSGRCVLQLFVVVLNNLKEKKRKELLYMTCDKFYFLLKERGLALNDIQKYQFRRFFETLIEWNERMNLTGITDKSEVYAKHFYDCLDPFLEMDMSEIKTVCDVGTGAGFPGIPLAFAYPDIQFDLIDSLGKRIRFLNFCSSELGMTNVKAVHIRAEDFVTDKREHFDLVTSRAVAKLPLLIELCAPLVKIGGTFVALKGPAGHAELQEAKQGPSKLGLIHIKTNNASIEEIGERVNIYFKKISETPKKYPRQFGQIKKKPLV